ncbi:substrate import-associated zinc metallohydrolase lipoprotein [Sphingobacterium lactis]|uniref:Substrate import-associated zinc metallohydrolase lipoprotein n=1 Tax=Sphingobacterium lactis TaxID=797291 RepID=A0A1H5WVR5_9SPHI|nr:substrate import-associated zinc metallohydrolase lipoprotein [Sphingobacterium lactis]SEG03679.1 substrate import-associated zinc metallohydrolase lipoprotein [Sphingobacterium lactis]
MKLLPKLFIGLSALAFLGSCAKEEIKNVDFSKYNDDNPQTNTELDKWLQTTFLDEYNIDVVYRYNRFYHDLERNVTPPKLEAVRPVMESVLNGYLLPYRKVGGEDFIKKMAPKEWILFGSYSYASDGTTYAGTASAGRRINLYGVNSFNEYGAQLVIHHEFVHILNQLVNIPTDFESISKADYKATWSSTPADTARKYGFVTSYASGSYTEDYAETAAHLLVKGQAWYDRYANTSSAKGKAALKAKEANVANYYTSNLKVDFRALQKEIQNYLKTKANPSDLRFPQYVYRLFKKVSINPSSPTMTKYGLSTPFKTAFDKLVANMKANGYNIPSVDVRFISDNQLVVRFPFVGNDGTTYYADYLFSYTLSTTTGEIEIKKIDQPTVDEKDAGTNYANASIAWVKSTFDTSLLPYFNNKTFVADWLRKDVDPVDYNNLGGFYEKDNSSNFWYGVLSQTL